VSIRIGLAERGFLPDRLIRLSIRHLDKKRSRRQRKLDGTSFFQRRDDAIG